jgi:hypothetical protein
MGQYRNDWYGTMNITKENNSLAVSLGNLHAISTAFTQKESIRIELVPGTGRVISFKIDDAGKINSLNYDGSEYKRIK